MAISVKISQLNDGGSISSADYIPAARGADTVKVNAQQFVVNGSNIGIGTGQLFSGTSSGAGTTMQFRTLSGADGITVGTSGNTLVVSASGQNPVKTSLTGNGVTTTFAINGANSINANNYRVDIDGVLQEPLTDYTINGSNIVFNPAPPNGSKVTVVSNNLVRAYDIVPSDGSVTPQKLNLLTGNVGIGTATPTFRLVAAQTATDGAWLHGSSTSSYLGLGGYSGTTSGAFRLNYERTTGAITFNGGSRDTPNPRMTIDASGNVGIGTTAPSQALTVVGSISATGQILNSFSRPTFTAGITGNVAFNSRVTGNTDAITNWNAKILDNTSSFNITTGRFVAPVTGLYWLSFNITYNTSTPTHFGDIGIYKNGISCFDSRPPSSSVGPVVMRPSTVWTSGTHSVAVSLDTGDYVSVGVASYSGNTGTFYLNFSGYLIG